MLVGAGAVSLAALADDNPHPLTHSLLFAPILGCVAGKLPDHIEPAIHPNHRQFFHSITIMSLLTVGLIKTYQWKPGQPLEKLIRGLVLLGGVGYLSHLLCDATTPKGLPLVGKL
jgi:membrane-bound metal-dependent hydrolase YbcI (DUF457 family)